MKFERQLLTEEDLAVIQVVMALDPVGVLEGVVRNSAGETQPHARVVLIPDNQRLSPQPELRSTDADASGRFSLPIFDLDRLGRIFAYAYEATGDPHPDFLREFGDALDRVDLTDPAKRFVEVETWDR